MICRICANGYDKSQEMAAAALAYKCMEVAYMRIVYFKSATTSRVWQDLQTSLQMVPQGMILFFINLNNSPKGHECA